MGIPKPSRRFAIIGHSSQRGCIPCVTILSFHSLSNDSLPGSASLTLAASSWLSAQPEIYLPQGLQTADRVPEDILPETMARLPQVSRDALDAVGQQAYDTYVRPGTGYENGPRGPVAMWLHSPVLAEAIFDVRQRVRYGTI